MHTVRLSAREDSVLRLIVWGYSNKDIARRLGITVKTVEAHKANGMRKLQFRARSGLVRQAVEWGWLTLENAPAETSPAMSVSASPVADSVPVP